MQCEAPAAVNQPKTRVPLSIEENLAGLILGLLALITFANVMVRYLTNFSFAFTEEISIFFMLFMTLLGSSSLMAKGGHLNITYFVDRVPASYRRGVQIAAAVLNGVMFLLLAIFGARMAWDEYRFEVTSPGLGIPTWIYTVWLPILALIISARAVGVIVRLAKKEP